MNDPIVCFAVGVGLVVLISFVFNGVKAGYRFLRWFAGKVYSSFKRRKPVEVIHFSKTQDPKDYSVSEGVGRVAKYKGWKESLDAHVAGKISLDAFVDLWSGWTILPKEPEVKAKVEDDGHFKPWRDPNQPYYGSVTMYCATSVGWHRYSDPPSYYSPGSIIFTSIDDE